MIVGPMDIPEGWALSADGNALERSFRFKDFSEAFGFLTRRDACREGRSSPRIHQCMEPGRLPPRRRRRRGTARAGYQTGCRDQSAGLTLNMLAAAACCSHPHVKFMELSDSYCILRRAGSLCWVVCNRRRSPAGRRSSELSHYWREGYAVVRGLFSTARSTKSPRPRSRSMPRACSMGAAPARQSVLQRRRPGRRPAGEDGAMAVLPPGCPQPCPARSADRAPSRTGLRTQSQADHQPDPLEGPGLAGRFRMAPGQPLAPARLGLSQSCGSYVQTGLAIDPHIESGCMRFIPRSHVRGDLGMDCSQSPWGGDARCGLDAVGLSTSDAVDLILEPGDLALWSPTWCTVRARTGRPPAPVLHQRLCAGARLRPGRMGVPRGPPGAVRPQARARPLRGTARASGAALRLNGN